MANEQEKMGLSPEEAQAKDEVNKEGWEGNAALHIGSREELDKLREQLETEGHTKDLATYLRLHKEIALHTNDPEVGVFKESLREGLETRRGHFFINEHFFGSDNDRFYGETEVIYVDKDGNIARVVIDPTKIDDYKGVRKPLGGFSNSKEEKDYGLVLLQDFKKLGFIDEFGLAIEKHEKKAEDRDNRHSRTLFEQTVHAALNRKKRRLEEEAQKRGKDEFSF